MSDAIIQVCGGLPPLGKLASMHTCVAVGFGGAAILLDGRDFLDGEGAISGRDDPASMRARRLIVRSRAMFLTLERVEQYLWRREKGGNPVVGKLELHIFGPMSGGTWERRAPREWVCTAADEGFA